MSEYQDSYPAIAGTDALLAAKDAIIAKLKAELQTSILYGQAQNRAHKAALKRAENAEGSAP